MNIVTPNVSVIVPVYNAEKYISECVLSLIDQTMKSCEFIFINDGSSDKSLQILQEFESRDARIKIISQENKGISQARNAGVLNAKGKYISFLDNDDFVKPDMYETLFNIGEKENLDIVISKTIAGRDGKYIIKDSIFPPDIIYDKYYIQTNIIENLLREESLFAVWNKIYRREFIAEFKIEFPPNRDIEEDNMFNLAAFNSASRVLFIDYAGYYYRDVGDSESRLFIERQLFEKALRKYQFDYKSYFDLKLDREYIEKLKGKRFFGRTTYLIFILSIKKNYSIYQVYEYCKKMLYNEELQGIIRNPEFKLSRKGIFQEQIYKTFLLQSKTRLLLLINIVRIVYSPRISEVLRKLNRSEK